MEDDDGAGAETPFAVRPLAVLIFAGGLTALTLISVMTAGASSLPVFRPYLAASALILFAVYFPLTLSPRLSALMVAALCMSFVWSLGFIALSRVVLTPGPVFAIILQHGVGALFMAANMHLFTQDSGRGMRLPAARRRAGTHHMAAWLAAFLAAEAGLTALLPADAGVMLAGIASALCVCAVSFWIVPALAGPWVRDEAHLARINRLREKQERYLTAFAALAVPRWAFALLGIQAVCFAILMFDAGAWRSEETSSLPRLWHLAGPPLGFAFLVTSALGGLAARDWRGVVVASAASFLSASAGAWLAARTGLAPPESIARLLVLGAAAGAAPCYVLLAALSRFKRFGDDFATALIRALGETAMPLVLTGFGVLASSALFALRFADGAAACLIVFCAFLGPFVFVPSLGAVMDNLFPKRRSLEDLYGAR